MKASQSTLMVCRQGALDLSTSITVKMERLVAKCRRCRVMVIIGSKQWSNYLESRQFAVHLYILVQCSDINKGLQSLQGRHKAGEGAEWAAIFSGGFFIPEH